MTTYQTRINPPRNMLRSIIYKTSLCCASSTKTMVKNLLGLCRIFSQKTKPQHVWYVSVDTACKRRYRKLIELNV